MGNVIVVLIIIALIALAIYIIINNRKKGVDSCGNDCANCSKCANCYRKDAK